MGAINVICHHGDKAWVENRNLVVGRGRYYRKSDGKWLRRFHCKVCGRSFSEESSSDCFGQNKRHMNGPILAHLTSGVSQRRSALLLKINRKTVVRKFVLMGQSALAILPKLGEFYPKAKAIVFDEMETHEHSKCKPLSIPLMVEDKTRRILGFRVAQMPAKGKLSKIALKKYGKREDHRKAALTSLFEEVKPLICVGALIKSDRNPHYPKVVKKHFPESFHETHKGRRGCVVGQGELKRGGRDPLFYLNHTCAMLRANINRLFRRTWCTTKLAERLTYHIAIYALYHNLILLKKIRPDFNL